MTVYIVVSVIVLLLLLLVLVGNWIYRRGVRSARQREVTQYECTLGDVGVAPSDGGSLGSLDAAYAVEDDERRNPRPDSYYADRSSMFAPWRGNGET